MMEYIKTTVISDQDALPLSMMIVEPSIQPVGIVQLVHGMAEHKERYQPLMEYLADLGYVVGIHDHRGHGQSIRSAEDLGYFYETGASALVEDTYQISGFLKDKYPQQPLFLFGHSMGSLIVRVYLKKYDAMIDGLIVCGSPSHNPAAGMGKWLAKQVGKKKGDHFRCRVINDMAFGAFAKSVKSARTTYDWLCTDPTVVDAYIEDPLCGYVFTVNGFEGLFGLMQETYRKQGWNRHHLQLPILFIAGEEDPCIVNSKKFEQAQKSLKKLGYTNIQSKLYPGLRHEILNEPVKLEIFKDVAQHLLTWSR